MLSPLLLKKCAATGKPKDNKIRDINHKLPSVIPQVFDRKEYVLAVLLKNKIKTIFCLGTETNHSTMLL